MSESLKIWGGGNRTARGQEKTETVLMWLAEFHYSTPSVLSKRLAVNANGQRAFFGKLVSNDIVRVVSVPTIRERLFLLTPNGRELARAITEKAVEYKTEPSKVTSSNVKHNLSIQLAVINRLANADNIFSERHLNFTDRKRLPDALIISGEICLAIEAELVHKNDARIYRGFYNHLAAIKKKTYTNVEYIFPSETLCNYYYKRFCEPLWPVFEYSQSGRLIKTKRDFNTVEGGVRDLLPTLFKFTTEKLY